MMNSGLARGYVITHGSRRMLARGRKKRLECVERRAVDVPRNASTAIILSLSTIGAVATANGSETEKKGTG
jgi:hypothetical protein